MAYWSQSAFLQALGWAMLNSFWQIGLLWALYTGAQYLFKLTSAQKYTLAVGGIGTGLLWYIYTFIVYYSAGAEGNLSGSQHTLAPTSNTWNIVLSSASIAYLLLLFIPAYKLFKNWQYLNLIKKHGLRKPSLEHKLFVKKIGKLLGIKKTVQVYISEFVTSPLTVGYLKPIILLPVAALNNLSTQQLEAVLLHELSHIKRFDYLINFIITFIHTLFYFNPFVKKFVAAIEKEREKCCDELVIQFEYDKVSYASALLTLEKTAMPTAIFAIGAAEKKYLLTRIEKIVGQERKEKFGFNQFTGIMASLVLVLLINSLFFVSRQKEKNKILADFSAFENPFYAFSNTGVAEDAHSVEMQKGIVEHNEVLVAANNKRILENATAVAKHSEATLPPPAEEPIPVAIDDENLINVAYDATDANMTTEQKQQVSQTIEATKKVLSTKQWQEVEKAIADGMTYTEKKRAKEEYLKEIEKADWKNLEKKLKAEYEQMDWQKINTQLQQALVSVQLDSIQQSYEHAITQLEIAEVKANSNCSEVLPMPDASVKELKAVKVELRKKLDSIKSVRTKAVIKL